MKRSMWLVYIVVIAAVLAMSRGGCRPSGDDTPPDAHFVEVRADEAAARHPELSPLSFVIRAELADTEPQRAVGLSGRRGLAEGRGMLYVFEDPQTPTFNESATQFPLTTAFLRHDGTIVELHPTTKNDPQRFAAPEPVRFVLQVRGGWFADRDIGKDDRLVLPDEVFGPPLPEPPSEPPADTPVENVGPIMG